MEEQTKLSDSQRRAVCRIVFLSLCVLPTSVIAYALFHQPTTRHWQDQIRAQLGIPIQIAAVETPVPFTTILRGVRIPGTFVRSGNQPNGDLLIDEIRIDVGDSKNVVKVIQPLEIPMQSLSQVSQRFMDHLGHIDFDHKAWRFEFAKIALTDAQSMAGDFDLKPVVMELQREEGEHGSRLTGSLLTKIPTVSNSLQNGQEELSEFCFLDLTFHENDMKMLTGNGGVPVRLLRYWCPDLQFLGTRCQLQGELIVEDLQKGSGSVSGRLLGVELDRISTPYSPGIVGQCNVEIDSCRFVENQIASAHMRIHSSQPIKCLSNLLMDARQLGIQTVDLPNQTVYQFPNLDLVVDILEGRLIFSGTEGSVISKDMSGDPCVTVHQADISVNELAQVMIGDTYSQEAVTFLQKFRRPQRMAKDSSTSSSRF